MYLYGFKKIFLTSAPEGSNFINAVQLIGAVVKTNETFINIFKPNFIRIRNIDNYFLFDFELI